MGPDDVVKLAHQKVADLNLDEICKLLPAVLEARIEDGKIILNVTGECQCDYELYSEYRYYDLVLQVNIFYTTLHGFYYIIMEATKGHHPHVSPSSGALCLDRRVLLECYNEEDLAKSIISSIALLTSVDIFASYYDPEELSPEFEEDEYYEDEAEDEAE